MSHCQVAPHLEPADGGSVTAAIRDPRDRSYAWLFSFDAMGIPPPPRGPLHLADIRRELQDE